MGFKKKQIELAWENMAVLKENECSYYGYSLHIQTCVIWLRAANDFFCVCSQTLETAEKI